MNASPNQRLIDGAAPKPPTVFVRTLSTPPGAPWDQARAAALEARVGAPLPLSEVVYRLKRLDAWSPGRPSRYAACYVRAQEAGETFEARVEVDGRNITIAFVSMAERNRRARRLGGLAAVVAVTTLSLATAISSALSVRSDTEDRIAAADLRATHRLRQAQEQARLYKEARLLDAAVGKHTGPSDLLSDIAWTASAKAPGAHIDALHWEHGYVAVEVRGEAAPFNNPDRPVLKAAKPVRPGVWLWGVGPAGSMGGSATTLKAEAAR